MLKKYVLGIFLLGHITTPLYCMEHNKQTAELSLEAVKELVPEEISCMGDLLKTLYRLANTDERMFANHPKIRSKLIKLIQKRTEYTTIRKKTLRVLLEEQSQNTSRTVALAKFLVETGGIDFFDITSKTRYKHRTLLEMKIHARDTGWFKNIFLPVLATVSLPYDRQETLSGHHSPQSPFMYALSQNAFDIAELLFDFAKTSENNLYALMTPLPLGTLGTNALHILSNNNPALAKKICTTIAQNNRLSASLFCGVNQLGETPLMHALKLKNNTIVDAILKAIGSKDNGSYLYIENPINGKTAFEYADIKQRAKFKYYCTSASSDIRKASAVASTVQKEHIPVQNPKNGRTAFEYADIKQRAKFNHVRTLAPSDEQEYIRSRVTELSLTEEHYAPIDPTAAMIALWNNPVQETIYDQPGKDLPSHIRAALPNHFTDVPDVFSILATYPHYYGRHKVLTMLACSPRKLLNAALEQSLTPQITLGSRLLLDSDADIVGVMTTPKFKQLSLLGEKIVDADVNIAWWSTFLSLLSSWNNANEETIQATGDILLRPVTCTRRTPYMYACTHNPPVANLLRDFCKNNSHLLRKLFNGALESAVLDNDLDNVNRVLDTTAPYPVVRNKLLETGGPSSGNIPIVLAAKNKNTAIFVKLREAGKQSRQFEIQDVHGKTAWDYIKTIKP